MQKNPKDSERIQMNAKEESKEDSKELEELKDKQIEQDPDNEEENNLPVSADDSFFYGGWLEM